MQGAWAAAKQCMFALPVMVTFNDLGIDPLSFVVARGVRGARVPLMRPLTVRLCPVVLRAVASTACIDGASMQPALNPPGETWRDRVLLDKLSIRMVLAPHLPFRSQLGAPLLRLMHPRWA